MWKAENNTNIDFLKTAVYRDDETAMFENMLLHNKVCVISGMAGIGKTYFAKMYSYTHENVNVVYISDYCVRDSRNCVIEHSFAENIKSNSLLIIDDIEDINLYIDSVFFNALKKLNPKNIVLITRQDVFHREISVLTLHPFTLKQTYELIGKKSDRYLYAKKEQIARLSNGNPVMIEVICSLLRGCTNRGESSIMST